MAEPTISDQGSPPGTSAASEGGGIELLTAGSRFARYEIVRCIGVGGMGAVFEATHSLLRKRVALKALHATLGRSDASRARFLREAETVARIRHPHVVDITDVGVEREIPFLVMEFLEGEDLASLLEREGKLEVTRAVDLLLPALAGLCAVHRLGIVHRDIKPENIFLAVDSLGALVPKLVDFGVSKDLDASSAAGAPQRHTVAGTPYYMSPEQARGAANLDARADQYAMAVVLYQCLAQARPFVSDSLLGLLHMIDAGEYLPLATRVPGLPPALAAVIERAMSRRLEDRYPTTEAFGQALAEFASPAVQSACVRDFSAERRAAMPPLRRASDAERERLSAPTRPSYDPPPESLPTIDQRPSKLSGVRARDTEPAALPAPAPHARRIFLLAFGAILILALGLGALLYRVPLPQSTSPEKVEPRVAPASEQPPAISAEPVRRADPPARETSQAEPARAQDPAPAPEHDGAPSRTRHKREGAPAAPAPVDIQLSR